jgi:hypothetical protein
MVVTLKTSVTIKALYSILAIYLIYLTTHYRLVEGEAPLILILGALGSLLYLYIMIYDLYMWIKYDRHG